MHSDIVIRKYKDGDEYEIVELLKQEFNLSINLKIDLTIWRWKYKENPAPTPAIIWVAEERNDIIGHYAVNPVMMKWKDRDMVSGVRNSNA